MEEEDWPLGYDAVDGGSTASVAAIVDGRTLVYAAVGDSAGILAQPGGGEAKVEELVAEHAPVRLDEWVARLHSTGIEARPRDLARGPSPCRALTPASHPNPAPQPRTDPAAAAPLRSLTGGLRPP